VKDEMTARSDTTTPAGPELIITRVFDAPRELVFKAWSEPERVMQWMGPKNFTALDFQLEGRPGGKWRGRMRSADGAELGNGGTIREIAEPERLVYSFTWDDEPDREMLISLTFVERGGSTEMTFRQTGFASVESRDGHNQGWDESFDKLAGYLAEAKKP
jgi:uncharacterized protein YndB with AHSA1/START domain